MLDGHQGAPAQAQNLASTDGQADAGETMRLVRQLEQIVSGAEEVAESLRDALGTSLVCAMERDARERALIALLVPWLVEDTMHHRIHGAHDQEPDSIPPRVRKALDADEQVAAAFWVAMGDLERAHRAAGGSDDLPF